MEAIKARRIPPEVDIVSPEWFAPIYADRSGGPIPIMGRVAASRAKSYDFKVQWAPGVQPAESDYRDVVAPLTNVPGSDGQRRRGPARAARPGADRHDAPARSGLAARRERALDLDPRPRGRSLRQRRRARRGATRRLGHEREERARHGSPAGLPDQPRRLRRGEPEARRHRRRRRPRHRRRPTARARLHVFTMQTRHAGRGAGLPVPHAPDRRPQQGPHERADGPELPRRRRRTRPARRAASIRRSRAKSLVAAPAIADLDGDGKAEIVFATWAGHASTSINSKGQDLPGWPKRLPLVPSCPLDPKQRRSPRRCMDLRTASRAARTARRSSST